MSGNFRDPQKYSGKFLLYPGRLAQCTADKSLRTVTLHTLGNFVQVTFIFCKCQAKIHHEKFGRVNNPENGKGEVNIDMMSLTNSNGYGGVPSELHSQGSECSDIHFFEGGHAIISIQVLQQVTNNFSEKNILGSRGFEVVYKGELHDGSKISVKRMKFVVTGSKELNEFQEDIAVLTKLVSPMHFEQAFVLVRKGSGKFAEVKEFKNLERNLRRNSSYKEGRDFGRIPRTTIYQETKSGIKGPVVGGYPNTLIIIQSQLEKDVLCDESGLTNWALSEVLDVSKNSLSGHIQKFPTKVMLNTNYNPFVLYIEGSGGSGTPPSRVLVMHQPEVQMHHQLVFHTIMLELQLEVLDVSKNNLSGHISKFPTKMMLNTNYNPFLLYIEVGGGSGTTPSSGYGDAPTGGPNAPLGCFSLSYAWIAGLTNLAQLEVLDVSKNNISDHIPKFSTKVMLNTNYSPCLLYIECGSGNGTTSSSDSGDAPTGSPNAPSDLTNLTQLDVLDVSKNNLSDHIPKFLTKVMLNTIYSPCLLYIEGGSGSGTTPSSGSGDAPTGSPNAPSGGFSLSYAWIVRFSLSYAWFVTLNMFGR
ncbi:hypothetical protein V8G54_026395 [Vigna mungo]|uniref:Uncharacterized protein n=1 Tax=Vigna mungo TaxID=3915 RepID=A0AAQ3N0B4_VIGMU